MPPLPIADFARRLPGQLATLRSLVEIESPSNDKAAVDRLGAHLELRFRALGAAVERVPQPSVGDQWIARWGDAPGGLLLLAHLDTVYPMGTLKDSPWQEDGDRLRGPGVLDMKASLAMALTAVEALQQAGRLPARSITLLCTSDEETGSHASRSLIEDLASKSSLVLCLEPALPNGSLKTERKGVGIFRLRIRGRSAHAGSNPEQGINAIIEMAHQVLRVDTLADPARGTTVNVGVIQGGTRSNVVPEECRARVDIRVDSLDEARRLDEAVAALRPVLPGATIEVEGGMNRPPMVQTPAMARAFARAQALGRELGLSLSGGRTGGGSDANFVAPLGVPVLDGLGAVGDGAHSPREFVVRDSLPERTALLAALLSEA
jgi:glutamate carboxypeptidase